MIGRDANKILEIEFANRYFITKNATTAALECNINPEYAAKQGCALKKRKRVKRELNRLLNEVKSETMRTAIDLEKKLWAIIDESDRDRVPAINAQMKLKGWEAPQKTESEIKLNGKEVIDELKKLLGAKKV